MTEILTDYFKGIKNYFFNFSKAKLYRIFKLIALILLLIIFNIIAIPCYLSYRYGLYKGIKEMRDSVDKKTPTYISGIHSKKSMELISISEIELPHKKKK